MKIRPIRREPLAQERRDTRSADIVSLLARAAAAHERCRFDDRRPRRRLVAAFASPCGTWMRFCEGDLLFYGVRLDGADKHRQERAA